MIYNHYLMDIYIITDIIYLIQDAVFLSTIVQHASKTMRKKYQKNINFNKACKATHRSTCLVVYYSCLRKQEV